MDIIEEIIKRERKLLTLTNDKMVRAHIIGGLIRLLELKKRTENGSRI